MIDLEKNFDLTYKPERNASVFEVLSYRSERIWRKAESVKIIYIKELSDIFNHYSNLRTGLQMGSVHN